MGYGMKSISVLNFDLYAKKDLKITKIHPLVREMTYITKAILQTTHLPLLLYDDNKLSDTYKNKPRWLRLAWIPTLVFSLNTTG
jgi:hypothetical protein